MSDKIIAKSARCVARKYARTSPWADARDLEHEAWIAAAMASRTWAEGRGATLESYCSRAAALAVRRHLYRSHCPVSVPQRYPEVASGIVGVRDLFPPGGSPVPSPEGWMSMLEREAEAIPKGERDALLGRETIVEAARREGVTKDKMAGLVRKHRRLLARNKELRKLFLDWLAFCELFGAEV